MPASCDALREHESTRGCEYTPPELIVFEQKHPTRMGARAASTWRLIPPQSQKPEKHILALLWPRTAMTIHLSPEQVCHGPPRLGQISDATLMPTSHADHANLTLQDTRRVPVDGSVPAQLNVTLQDGT